MLSIEVPVTSKEQVPGSKVEEFIRFGAVETIVATIIRVRYVRTDTQQPPRLIEYSPNKGYIGYTRELAALLYYDLLKEAYPESEPDDPIMSTLKQLDKSDLYTYFHYGSPVRISEEPEEYALILKGDSNLKCHLKRILPIFHKKGIPVNPVTIANLLAKSIQTTTACSKKKFSLEKAKVVIEGSTYNIETHFKHMGPAKKYTQLEVEVNNISFLFPLFTESIQGESSLSDRVKRLILMIPQVAKIRAISPTTLVSAWWASTYHEEVSGTFIPQKKEILITYSLKDSNTRTVVESKEFTLPFEEDMALPLKLEGDTLLVSYPLQGVRVHIEVPLKTIRLFPKLMQAAALLKAP